jgi:3D (Asp-Asp-Asp) domain-containing protein
MLRPKALSFGFPKTQAILALFILAIEIILPSEVVYAASVTLDTKLQGAPIGREYIRPVQRPIVMLEGEALQKRADALKEQEQASIEAIATTYMTASAYNSVPGQTDGSPYLTAIGSLTRDGVVASNYFPIGTRIRFPDIYGDKEFRVEDRMNQRYHKVVDIWMQDIADAKKFGRRYVKVEIVKYGLGRGKE